MRWFLTPGEQRALRRVVKMLGLNTGGFLMSVVYGAATLGSAIGLAAVSAWLIARASQMPPVLVLSVAATAVRMFGVLRALLRYMQRIASHKVALGGMDSLRLSVYDGLMEGPIDQVARLQRGDLLARIGADIDAVGDYVVKSLLPFTVAAVVGVGTVVGFAFLSVPAAIVVAFGLAVSGILAPMLMAKAAREAEALEQAAHQDLSVTSLSVLESADELAINGRLATEYGRVNTISERLNRARRKAAQPMAFAAALDKFAMGATVIGVMIVAIPETNAGMVAAVALAVLVLTPLAAFEGTADLGGAAVQMIKSARAAERITDLLGPEETKAQPTHDVPAPAEGRPALVAKDLSVGWPGRPTTLEGVNLKLEPGQVIAIVGPSGIGKSTLLYTLAGMLEPKHGEANLNGAPLWGAERQQVASYVSLTTEDAHVFATTVVENIRVARADVSEEEAEELLEQVGLGPWVKGLPNGLHTMLGVGATTISGGERRRLLLARALASPAPLLLLDEPGEHLDAETADAVLQQLFQGSGSNRGIVVVTHRLSSLRDADYVLRIGRDEEDQNSEHPAKVTASGTHQQLLASEASYKWAQDQE